jgi:hypothetical protein
MSGFSNAIIGGAEKLIRKAIQSPNYSVGVAGWSINKDGSAEFNNLTIRGSFFGTNFIINSSGAFFYSGTPATGNLIIAIAPAAGTDAFGNGYPKGVSTQQGGIEAILVGSQLGWDAPADHPTGALPSLFANPSLANGNSIEITTGIGTVGGKAGALTLYDNQGSSSVPAIPSGSPGIFVAQGCPIVTDTWHSMPAMSAGWTVGGHASYTMMPDGWLGIAFKDLVPSTDADGTVIWAAGSLPAAYRVGNAHRVVCYTNIIRVSGAAFEMAALEFETDGSIQCFGIAAAAGRVDLFTVVPLTDT